MAKTTNITATIDVYCKMPQGVCFDLKCGSVTIKGKPLSALVDPNGNPAPGTAYGVTTLTAEQWEEITGKYGHMAMFAKDSPVIFAAPSKKGDAQANEQANVKTGFEQVQVDGANADKSLNTTPDKS
ncbi:MAG: hypothetical protein RBR41_14475 [Desulfovibrio sp.]|uniref:hypothetical protein n=1 Tax=Desulfovibrio sp. TaxID=885 RepID=UPI002A36C32C|nr:hypothetical protein [Desulfovibrio sp.]MDY0260855.1 hypothetical protein [Desulfovibrio sp.]